MTFLEFCIFLGLAIWLWIHSRRSGERIRRLEEQLREHSHGDDAGLAPIADSERPLARAKREASETPVAAVASEPAPLVRPPVIPPPLPPASPPSPAFAPPEFPPVPVAAPRRPDRLATPPAPPPRIPQTAFEWKPILEKVKLWPPSGENAEAAIGAWWLSRLGLIVLIIGAVFFGVRIAENTPPGVRLATLAAIAGGVAVLGAWLERKLPAFGRLISAGGLALGYFVAFAAYGLQATKVIENPAAGFMVQAIAVAVVAAWSWWKRDETIATMAVLLGFVACAFSHHFALDEFLLAGLLSLAAAGSALLVLRGWRWPHGVGMGAVWIGFLVIGVTDWENGQGPGLAIELGSIMFLVGMLEAASFIDYQRRPVIDLKAELERWRRWLSVANTSLAAGVGWVVIRFAYPPAIEDGQLSIFYISVAALFGLFASFRLWKRHPLAITETYFLKATGLLALFFVAWFEGPTRWLSLSGQVLAMLCVWRRSQLKWVGAGIIALFLGTLIVMLHDILSSMEDWTFVGVRQIAGLSSLTLLSSALALHGRWAVTEGKSQGTTCAFMALRVIGASAVALIGILLSLGEANPGIENALQLSFGALVLAVPAVSWHRWEPVLTGLLGLGVAVIAYAVVGGPSEMRDVWIGIWLLLLVFGLAEALRRFWQPAWRLGHEVRTLLHGSGLLVLFVLFHRHLQVAPPELRVAAMLGTAVIGAFALIRQGLPLLRFEGPRRPHSKILNQRFLAVVSGVAVVAVAIDLLASVRLQGSLMAVAAAVFFLSALRIRNLTTALAGAVPLFAGVGFHLLEFNGSPHIGTHLLGTGVIVSICLGTAFVVSHFKLRWRISLALTCILNALSIGVVHWWLRTHLPMGGVLLADTGIALGLTALANRVGLRGLWIVSPLPVVFCIAHLCYGFLTGEDAGFHSLWWGSAAALLTWLWIGRRRLAAQDGVQSRRAAVLFRIHATLVALGLSFSGFHMLPNPWMLVSLGGLAVALAVFGRWHQSPSCQIASLLPLLIGVLAAGARVGGIVKAPDVETLISVAILALMVAGHGVLLVWKAPRGVRQRIWGHSIVALGMVFAACAADHLGIDALTTVCWGVAAVVHFVIGLVAGLKPYRLTGLAGLGLSMIRMFIVDIDDPLYRIYAFFAIAAVLLGVGYLYHRFRHFIARADGLADRSDADLDPS